MNCGEAALKSGMTVAYRSKADGSLMFWDGAILWTQIAPGGHLKRYGGGHRAAQMDDWLSLYDDPPNHPLIVWLEKKGEIADPQWKGACNDSSVRMATREHKGGFLMVRSTDGRTWLQNPSTDALHLLTYFQHCAGWQPMPGNHVLAAADYSQARIPFRDSSHPPEHIKDDPVQIEEWSRTGTCTKLREHQAKTNGKCAKCLDTKRVTVPGEQDSIPCPSCDPHDCRGFPIAPKSKPIDPASPLGWHCTETHGRKPCVKCELPPKSKKPATMSQADDQVLAALGPLATSLADSIKVMAEIGETASAVDLAKQLRHLVSNSSWLLREDRC